MRQAWGGIAWKIIATDSIAQKHNEISPINSLEQLLVMYIGSRAPSPEESSVNGAAIHPPSRRTTPSSPYRLATRCIQGWYHHLHPWVYNQPSILRIHVPFQWSLLHFKCWKHVSTTSNEHLHLQLQLFLITTTSPLTPASQPRPKQQQLFLIFITSPLPPALQPWRQPLLIFIPSLSHHAPVVVNAGV